MENYLDIYEAPNTVMTAAATPELETAEGRFRDAKIELNQSDADFQRSSAKVNTTVFSGEERKWMVDKATALKYLIDFDSK